MPEPRHSGNLTHSLRYDICILIIILCSDQAEALRSKNKAARERRTQRVAEKKEAHLKQYTEEATQ